MDNGNRVETLKLITHILLKMKFQAHQCGYQYVREAIYQGIEDSELMTSVTKLLYPSVAKVYGVDGKRVERAIRASIETAWREEKWQVIDQVFSEHEEYHEKRPTNTDFIKGIIQYISKEKKYIEDV